MRSRGKWGQAADLAAYGELAAGPALPEGCEECEECEGAVFRRDDCSRTLAGREQPQLARPYWIPPTFLREVLPRVK